MNWHVIHENRAEENIMNFPYPAAWEKSFEGFKSATSLKLGVLSCMSPFIHYSGNASKAQMLQDQDQQFLHLSKSESLITTGF